MTDLTITIFKAAKAAKVYGWLLLAVCTVESNLNPALIHHNDGGSSSYGLCQIKKYTAKTLGFTGNYKELLNPYTNAYYSGLYLKQQLDKYQNVCHGVAAYNSGIYNESKYPKIPRNIKYVRRVENFVDITKKKYFDCRK